jgi:hypothetical protein
MVSFPPVRDIQLQHLPPRCIGCGYILLHLDEPRCPECGRGFNPDDDRTYRRQPGFVFWRYWLPGFLQAIIPITVLACLFLWNGAVGWGLVLGAPISLGCLLGYGVRARWVWRIILAIAGILFVVGTLMMFSLAGPLCGFVLSILFLIPASIGVALGIPLRHFLKDSKFSQRWYLPIIAMLLIPLMVQGVEILVTSPPPREELSTTVILPCSLHAAWESQVFKGMPGPPKVGAMHVGLPVPLETTGHSAVNELKTIRFSKGELSVRITDRVEDQRLAFDYIGQAHVEDRAVRLISSKFDFVAMGQSQTRVILSTRYQPLMTPRWYWRPFERWAGESMHRYILQAMADDANRHAAESSPASK